MAAYIFAVLVLLIIITVAYTMRNKLVVTATPFGPPPIGSVVTAVSPSGATQIAAPSASSAAVATAAAASAVAATAASTASKVLPRQLALSDCGWNTADRGWFDLQGLGVNNDYCRWVGGNGPNSGGGWFACALAGSTTPNTPNWREPGTPPYVTTPSGAKLWLDPSLAPSPMPAGNYVIDPKSTHVALAAGDSCYR